MRAVTEEDADPKLGELEQFQDLGVTRAVNRGRPHDGPWQPARPHGLFAGELAPTVVAYRPSRCLLPEGGSLGAWAGRCQAAHVDETLQVGCGLVCHRGERACRVSVHREKLGPVAGRRQAGDVKYSVRVLATTGQCFEVVEVSYYDSRLLVVREDPFGLRRVSYETGYFVATRQQGVDEM